MSSSLGKRSLPQVPDVVATLLRARASEGFQVVELAQHVATLVSPKGRILRVFERPSTPEGVEELLERCLSMNPKEGSEVVIIGGPRSEAELIREVVPSMPRSPFAVYRMSATEGVQSFSRVDRKMLHALESVERLTDEELSAFLTEVQSTRERMMEESRERAGFFRSLQGRVPRGTYGILGVIAVMFALQNLWGFDNAIAYSMGALHGPSVEAGEWWRLLSVGFLHGGLMHVGMNGFVLYLLGGQLERVIGTPRFLLLYTVSLVAGAFASMQILDPRGLSVGASGAIWGLLGAQLSLAYGRPPVVPRTVMLSLRPMARQNLMLNVGISVLGAFSAPGSLLGSIDWAAHFGGGLAGGLLLASGLLHRGDAQGHESSTIRLLAMTCVGVILLALATALWQGQAWNAEELLAQLRQAQP